MASLLGRPEWQLGFGGPQMESGFPSELPLISWSSEATLFGPWKHTVVACFPTPCCLLTTYPSWMLCELCATKVNPAWIYIAAIVHLPSTVSTVQKQFLWQQDPINVPDFACSVSQPFSHDIMALSSGANCFDSNLLLIALIGDCTILRIERSTWWLWPYTSVATHLAHHASSNCNPRSPTPITSCCANVSQRGPCHRFLRFFFHAQFVGDLDTIRCSFSFSFLLSTKNHRPFN